MATLIAKMMLLGTVTGIGMAVVFFTVIKFGLLFASLIGLMP